MAMRRYFRDSVRCSTVFGSRRDRGVAGDDRGENVTTSLMLEELTRQAVHYRNQ